MGDSQTPILALREIHKAFGGITAIQALNLEIMPGEIVALVGDNGAGKSTLVKIIAGVFPATSGQIVLGGEEVHFANPRQSQDRGIQVVYQDLALADSQPVYMNMFLGREKVKGLLRRLDRKAMISETEELVRALDVRIPSARARIRELSGGQRQGVAIARATHGAGKLILMDEPTAALGVAETARVENSIRALKADDRAILIVSHNLDQVFRLADRICVLRRGVQVGVKRTSETTNNEIVSMITGLISS